MSNHTRDRSMSPQSSMTLKISRSDAKRMLEASRALNERLIQLQKERDGSSIGPSKPACTNDGDDDDVKRVVSTSEHGSVASDDASKLEGSTQTVLEAASSTRNALVQTFLASLKGLPEHEIRVGLLLFLDVGKSTKLMKAFRTLSSRTESKAQAALTSQGARSLFRCLLTAISLCIDQTAADKKDGQGPPRKARKESKQSSPNSKSNNVVREGTGSDLPRASPSFDSSMNDGAIQAITISNEMRKEIQEIALFATERLLHHVRKLKQDEMLTSITFEEFGGWYNSGGCSIVPWLELLDLSKWEAAGSSAAVKQEDEPNPESMEPIAVTTGPVNFFEDGGKRELSSRPIVSFDFTGAMSAADGTKTRLPPFCISLTEENLIMLKNLVERTGIAKRTPADVCGILLGHATKCSLGGRKLMVLHRNQFARCVRELVPSEASSNFSTKEMEHFSRYFTDFFCCFENGPDGLGRDQVNVKELAVAFSFLCAGNKSAKLAAGFELLDEEKAGHLTDQQLSQYVRSYLTMLVGISLLAANPDERQGLTPERQMAMLAAVENGTRWTLNHIIKHFAGSNDATPGAMSFEKFANWYTDGGYKVAPWLELLDLSKLLALLEDVEPKEPPPPPSSGRLRQTTASTTKATAADILFTFPLANRRSLVVLREDAVYVKSVVEKLSLLAMMPENLWTDLYKAARSQPAVPALPQWTGGARVQRKAGTGKGMDVNQATFVRCMEGVMASSSSSGKRRSSAMTKQIPAEATETVRNFFQSFDLEQTDRVGLNQLMGGLSLLCGGKKSTKLAFAFGLFDSRNDIGKKSGKPTAPELTPSLNGEELFLFLRSFLIVMFSCCQQSMDLSAEQVGRYISDSAHMVADDVMRYQWTTRKRDRVDFDEFGEWYNEGGFETAPWLELLDLTKWVMVDDFDAVQHRKAAPKSGLISASHSYDCPPAPPDDSLTSFFEDSGNALMPMGSLDEMDMMLMPQPSQDKENASTVGNASINPIPLQHQQQPSRSSESLKFHLVTYESQGGYQLSVSQRRVSHLRHILLESGLHQIDSEEASKIILDKASQSSSRSSGNNGDLKLSKDTFDSAMRQVVSLGSGKANMTVETQRALSDLLAWIYTVFDKSGTGQADAVQLACGMTVLCSGKKSDKLEYGFEVLDKDQNGKLSQRETSNYLKSFLTTLLSVASAPCLDSDPAEDSISYVNNGGTYDQTPAAITRAADKGAEWAAGQAFKSVFKGNSSSESDEISFDSFAEWYTTTGYTSIPWLELLDLRKWVMPSQTN